MRPLPALSHAVSIAVYDANPDQQRLLAATLYGLGCRTVSLDDRSDSPATLAAQLVAAPPDVLVWQVGQASDRQYARLRRLMEDGVLGQSGVVLATATPAQALSELGGVALAVTMLPAPYSLAALMQAIAMAQPQAALAVRH